jgi:hypothetical protein
MMSASTQMPFSLLLIGIACSFLITVAGAVKAHNTKQRIFYSSSVDGLLLMLVFSLAFTGQFILTLVFIFIVAVFSIAMLPMVLEIREKELRNKIQETETSSRLTVRDLFSDVLWLKLIARWGLWKSLGLTYLAFLAGIAGILWAMSQLYVLITPTFMIIYDFTFSSVFIIILYAQIRKVADQRTRAVT